MKFEACDPVARIFEGGEMFNFLFFNKITVIKPLY